MVSFQDAPDKNIEHVDKMELHSTSTFKMNTILQQQLPLKIKSAAFWQSRVSRVQLINIYYVKAYYTTGRKTIENSEFPIEFSMSLEGVSVLRTNFTRVYNLRQSKIKIILNNTTNPGIENGGLLIKTWTPN